MRGVTTILEPQPRPLSRRGWAITAVTFAVFLLALLAISSQYRGEGGAKVTGGSEAGGDKGLVVSLEPLSVDAVLGTMNARLSFTSMDSDITDPTSMRLTKDVRVSVITWEGVQEYTYYRGSYLGRASIELGLDGDSSSYPFDQYTTEVFISAVVIAKGAGSESDIVQDLLVQTTTSSWATGWNMMIDLPTEPNTHQQVSIWLDRVFSTKLFAIGLLALMVVLAGVSLWIGILVASYRRPAEIVLMAWTTSLLFALPLLRNTLPNAPPIGAAIDIYVFFWVLTAALISTVLVTVTWTRLAKATLLKDELFENEQVSPDRSDPATHEKQRA